MAGRIVLQGHQAKPEDPRVCRQFPKYRAHSDMDSTMCFSAAELIKVPFENRLILAADTPHSPVTSILKKRSDGLDQAISAR